jgi:CHAT domain-containing protein/Tfp pilus assembly protein PilF
MNAPRTRNRLAIVARSLLLLVTVAVIWSHSLAPRTYGQAKYSERDADDLTGITGGKPVVKELLSGDVHVYKVELKSRQYCRVIIEQRGTNLSIAIYGPDDRKLDETLGREHASTPLSLIAETAGTYRLEVRALEKRPARGRYELKTEEIRIATKEDGYRIAADRARREAERLLAEWKVEFRPKAVEKCEGARANWRKAGERAEEADTLNRIGEIYELSGEPKRALRYYDQALSIGGELNDQRRIAQTKNLMFFVHLLLGDTQKAFQCATEALRLSRDGGYKNEEAQALYNVGEYYSWLGDFQETLNHLNEAMPLWDSASNRRGAAQILTRLGFTYRRLSETQKALHSYQQALSLWSAVNDERWRAETLTELGHLYSRLGEKQKALNLFNQAVRLAKSIGVRIWEASALNGAGYVYEGLGENHRALDYYMQALQLFEVLSLRTGEAQTLNEIGRVQHSLGEYQKAIDCYEKALSMARALALESVVTMLLNSIGFVHESLGEETKALDYYEQALSNYERRSERREQARTLNNIGRIREGRGERQKALAFYDTALSLNRKAEDRFNESVTLYNIARLERDGGNLAEARSRLEDALRIFESLRIDVASHELRASYFASVRQRYDFYVDLLMRLHALQPSGGFDAEALQVSERARARSLLESLVEARAEIRQGVAPELLERERSLQQALSDKAQRKMNVLSGKPNQADVAAIERQIRDLNAEYEEVQEQIRSTSPRYAALTQPQPLGLRAIQDQVLDENTLLLEYSLGDERSYLWAVTKTSITSHKLPNRAEIEIAARRIYELLIARQSGGIAGKQMKPVVEAEAQYLREAASLSQVLLGPVAGQLGGKRLLIIPEGALQYLPFAALPVPSQTEIRDVQKDVNSATSLEASIPLVLTNEIVSLPSASVLAVLRRESRQAQGPIGSVAVLADPVFESDDPRLSAGTGAGKKDHRPASSKSTADGSDVHRALQSVGVLRDSLSIPRLVSTRREAEAIMAVASERASLKAIGFDASRSTAESPELRKYRVVHFATHGVLNAAHPELSGIVLSLFDKQGRPQNGFLRLHDIYNLDLPADLVVLSACNTGLGKDVKGEGLVGIVRAFMYAGARRVVASLWKVEDEATAELMKRFYQHMFEGGMAPAAALRAAQTAMRQQKRWRSPYYWAAFVLQGEWEEWPTKH